MSRWERLFLGIMLGFIMPVLLLLAGWWSSLAFVPVRYIKYYALGGFAIGILLDIFFLGGWVKNAYNIRKPILFAIYMFYTIGIFGFFMGVPLFNIIPGVYAGIYVGRRLLYHKAKREQLDSSIKAASMFTTAVIIAVCIAAAAIALFDPHTPANLKGMLGLEFTVTMPMVYGIIAIGGAVLITLQYGLTRIAAYRAFGDYKGKSAY